MKNLIRLVLVATVTLSVSGYAQQSDSSDVPDKAQVMKFLDLMHTRSQMTQMLDEMSKQIRLGAEQSFKQRVPNATPEQLAKVDKLFDGIFTSLPIDDMLDAIVPIYQKHLTRSDLGAITEFYSSPAGQKIVSEMPAILKESMQAGGEIGQRAFAAKSDEFEKKFRDLVNQDGGKTTGLSPANE